MSRAEPDRDPAFLAVAPGVRRLAQALARDLHGADDIEQEAWLRALERRPWMRGDAAPWFARVLRNLAQLGRRADARRQRREREAARPEAQAASDELLLRAELHRELVGHVMALREPYRGAILLRYLEGLPPRAIARRLGLPVSTVRSHIARGLELLRARLARGPDGRERTLAIASLARATRARPWIEGAVLVSLKSKLAAALLLALALIAFLPALRSGPEPVSAEPSPIEFARAMESSSSRDALAIAAERQPELALAKGAAAIDPERELSGEVVFPDGSPALGAELTVLRPEARQIEGSSTSGEPRTLIATLHADERGRFRIELETGRGYDLEVRVPGWVRETLLDRYPGEHVRVVLRRGASLRGRIAFEPDGAPIADAAITVHEGVLGRSGDPIFSTRSDADGMYRLDALPTGFLRVRASPGACADVFDEILAREDGAELALDLRVPRGIAMRGRVTDGRTGAPLSGAAVGGWFEEAHRTRTDSDGAYELLGLVPSKSASLLVSAPGYGCFTFRIAEVPGGDLEQDFFLLPGRRARGRVVDTAGSAIAGARLVAYEAAGFPEQRDHVCATADADGRFELADLRADLPHLLLAHRSGLATTVIEFPDDELEREQIELGDVVMQRPASIAGRVVDPKGDAMPDVWVLLTAGLDTSRGASGELTWFREGYGLGRVMARTDARGRYAFADLPPGRYWLSAGDKGWERRAELELTLEVGEAPDNVVLELDPRLSIEGVVVDERGEPLPNRAVRAWREDGPHTYNLSREDGRFALHGLDAGDYKLICSDRGAGLDQVWPGVAAGTSDVRLVFERLELVSVEGLVVAEGGAPLAGSIVTWQSRRPDRFGATRTADAAGRFRFELERGEPVDLFACQSVGEPWVEVRGVLPESGPITLVLPVARGAAPTSDETLSAAESDR